MATDESENEPRPIYRILQILPNDGWAGVFFNSTDDDLNLTFEETDFIGLVSVTEPDGSTYEIVTGISLDETGTSVHDDCGNYVGIVKSSKSDSEILKWASERMQKRDFARVQGVDRGRE